MRFVVLFFVSVFILAGCNNSTQPNADSWQSLNGMWKLSTFGLKDTTVQVAATNTYIEMLNIRFTGKYTGNKFKGTGINKHDDTLDFNMTFWDKSFGIIYFLYFPDGMGGTVRDSNFITGTKVE